MEKETIFISSVQDEFEKERKDIKSFILHDKLLQSFFDVFLFEDLPSKDKKPDKLYLDKIDKCSVFIALYGHEYGFDIMQNGSSPIEMEFDRATINQLERLVFLSSIEDEKRHPKLVLLINKIKKQLKYCRYSGKKDLIQKIYESLFDYLVDKKKIQIKPFDSSITINASLDDISEGKIRKFLTTARRERKIALSESASPNQVLIHLNLLENDSLLNSAILLFGKDPQKFFPLANIKCVHYHGTTVEKPLQSYQVFEGSLFEQLDSSVDFVLSRLVRRVNSRVIGPQTIVEYEIPKEAISEILVNAIVHRDYSSNSSVQVFIFSDRIEIFNPGRLPRGYSIETLKVNHESKPSNPLMAKVMFYAHYIEHVGTGTLDVIRLCRIAGLPDPDFLQNENEFVVILWRDWLNKTMIQSLNLNERQKLILPYLKQNKKITTGEYSKIANISIATSKRDLDELVKKGVLLMKGAGRGTYYEYNKQLKNSSIGS